MVPDVALCHRVRKVNKRCTWLLLLMGGQPPIHAWTVISLQGHKISLSLSDKRTPRFKKQCKWLVSLTLTHSCLPVLLVAGGLKRNTRLKHSESAAGLQPPGSLKKTSVSCWVWQWDGCGVPSLTRSALCGWVLCDSLGAREWALRCLFEAEQRERLMMPLKYIKEKKKNTHF